MSSRRFLLALLVGCAGSSPAPSVVAPSGEVALIDGRVWTGDPEHPRAESLLVRGSQIALVGTTKEVLRAKSASAKVIDLAERYVVPGLIDSHVHIQSGGLSAERLELGEARTRAEILKLVTTRAKERPSDPWILGRGWSYDAFGKSLPTRQDLDSVVADRPVYLRSYDGHTAWVNSRALDLAGITEQTPDPPGGKIVRESGSTRPSGALLEEAISLVVAKVPEPTREQKRRAILRALNQAAALGVTAMCEVGAPLQDLAVFEELDRDGALPIRVVYGPAIEDGIEEWAEARKRLSARSESRLSAGPLKGFMDGVIESNTAALIAPYADGSGKGSDPQLSEATLREQLTVARKAGIDVAYHAIGDRAVRRVLDAVEATRDATGATDFRPRIEHIEVIDPADVPRFVALGVIPSMMPVHVDPGDAAPSAAEEGTWMRKVGKQRMPMAFAFGALRGSGARLAFGSDWPVMSLSPLRGIAIAVTRQNAQARPKDGWLPEQRITLDDALRAYTSDAAYAVRLENTTGVLRPGLAADLVVLSGEIDFADPLSFHRGKADLTMVSGNIVYQGEQARAESRN